MPKLGYRQYTDVLNRRPAENICHAFDYARYQGTPLNRYVVSQLSRPRLLITATWIVRRRSRQVPELVQPPHPANCTRRAPASPKYVYTLWKIPPGSRAHANWVVSRSAPSLTDRVRPEAFAAGSLRKVVRREPWVRPQKSGASIRNTYKTLAKYVLKGLDPLYVRRPPPPRLSQSRKGAFTGDARVPAQALAAPAGRPPASSPERDRDKLAAAANSNARNRPSRSPFDMLLGRCGKPA